MYQYKLSDNIRSDENINIFRYSTTKSDYEHTHQFIEIVYITSGTGEHVINGIQYPVERGDMLFINYGQTHSFSSEAEMTIVNCLIKPEFIGKELVNSENALEILTLSSFEEFGPNVRKLVSKIRFHGETLLEIEMLFERMLIEFAEKAMGYRTAIQGFLQVVLTRIFREMRKADGEGIVQQLNKVAPEILQYIEVHCFEKISLQELAEKCFYNPSYFSRIFKECYGKSLTAFIHEKRIDEAIRLLKETNMTVDTVGLSVGYTGKKQFYKIFKQLTGLTPNRMRDEITKSTTLK